MATMTPRNLLSGLLISIASILVFLGVAEFGIRVCYPLLKNYNLEMWRYAKDLKMPLEDNDLPFHHHPNEKGTYYGVEICTNSEGFRGPERKPESGESKQSIFLLGDSFTLGWGVPQDSTLATRIQNKFRVTGNENVEVLNLGVCNYNTVLENALFQRVRKRITPSAVVLMYFVNDTEPTPEHHSGWVKPIISRSYLLALTFDRLTQLRSRFSDEFQWHQYYKALYSVNNPGKKQNEQAFDEIAVTCKNLDIPLMVVSIPEMHDLQDYPFQDISAWVQRLCTKHEVLCIDLLPYFQQYEESTLWVSAEDAHANSKANGIMAQVVYAELKEKVKSQ